MGKIKNSYQVVQINQYQGPISFQFSMKTIITFCSIWPFLGVQMDPVSKMKRSLLRLAPHFQGPLIKGYVLVNQFQS